MRTSGGVNRENAISISYRLRASPHRSAALGSSDREIVRRKGTTATGDCAVDQAAQQVGTPKERAVCRRRAAQHEVIAAARPCMVPVEHEFLGGKARVPRLLVERRRLLDELRPVGGRRHVHFDHSRIGGDVEMRQPRITRRRIALKQHAHAERSRRRFDGGDQIEVVVNRFDRRHENAQHTAPRLDAQRRANDSGCRLTANGRGPDDVFRRYGRVIAALDPEHRESAAARAARTDRARQS